MPRIQKMVMKRTMASGISFWVIKMLIFSLISSLDEF